MLVVLIIGKIGDSMRKAMAIAIPIAARFSCGFGSLPITDCKIGSSSDISSQVAHSGSHSQKMWTWPSKLGEKRFDIKLFRTSDLDRTYSEVESMSMMGPLRN